MSYEDKTLKCKICGNDFVFTAGEQEFYASRGLENEPVRCPECRNRKKQENMRGRKEFFTVTCAQCGCETTVPFKPSGIKPVLCRDCFEAQKKD
ncbi:MAG: zinc-ribbon domain containing protein [Armatimonadetes bacterium]|nr:zinc-ribbon domain containing protein [Candidatus Hippobium faecium]